jgi:hypothetical protein
MATLLTEKIGQGPTRRCDERCYSAKHKNCHCVCLGRNHGVGILKALENVRETFLPIIEKAAGGMELGKELRNEHAWAVGLPPIPKEHKPSSADATMDLFE